MQPVRVLITRIVKLLSYLLSVREKQKAEGAADGPSRTGCGALWPPLRAAAAPAGGAGDPRALCASGVLHGALLAVLHRGVHRRAPDAPAPHAPPDHVLALAAYLLHVAADMHAERQGDHHVCVRTRSNLVTAVYSLFWSAVTTSYL